MTLDPDKRRRMREAANAHRHRSDERGLLSGMLWSALDALEQAERERDEARERLEKAERLCATRLPTPPDVMGSALKARFGIDLTEAPPARSVREDD